MSGASSSGVLTTESRSVSGWSERRTSSRFACSTNAGVIGAASRTLATTRLASLGSKWASWDGEKECDDVWIGIGLAAIV